MPPAVPEEDSNLLIRLIRARVNALLEADQRISIRAACREICSPTTFYEFDDKLPDGEKLSAWIRDIERKRRKATGKVARRRGAATDAARIEALRAEAADWQRRYEAVLERVTLMEIRLKKVGVDANAIYREGLVKPNRTVNRSGGVDGEGSLRASIRVL